jgi:universal stress protein E
MPSIRNVLVIVDPTAEQHPAVSKGAALAAACAARLELLICDTRAARAARLAAERLRDPTCLLNVNLLPMLEALAAPLRSRGLDVAVECLYSERLLKGLMDVVKRTNAEVVIKDTHHHSLARRTFLSNTDWQLIRCCPKPLLLTKATQWANTPVIAAAIDPDHVNDKPAALDHRILGWAEYLAARLSGGVHAIHGYIPLAMAVAASAMPPLAVIPAQVLEDERAARYEQLRTLTQPYAVAAADTHLKMGVASEVLPEVAAQIHADIVVMGVIARSGLEAVFIGSTAERVLEQLPADILVIKPLDFGDVWPF